MTRKQALLKALSHIEQNQGNKELIDKLLEIKDDLPLNHWSDSSVRDAVEQFIIDNNRVPTTNDFKSKSLPPHPTFKKLYNLTLKEWLDLNYPNRFINTHRFEETEKINEIFIKEYQKIKPHTSKMFDRERTDSQCWQSVAVRNGTTSWCTLIKILKLKKYNAKKPKINVNVTLDILE